jgi:SAM-dependent methyltransferase
MAGWLSGDGIEIGALHNPLHLPAAAKARYVDRASMAELQAQYPEQIDLVPVSIVGDACDLGVLEDESVDFVVANHVIEHLPDPISGLQEMARVTRTGGLLYLAIPDQRATFDRRRPITATAHLVDEFRNGTEQTRRAHVQEFVELAERSEAVRPEDKDAVAARVNELLASDYSIHYHVFRPDSFTDLIYARLCCLRR